LVKSFFIIFHILIACPWFWNKHHCSMGRFSASKREKFKCIV
jgi:hypothetical protein